MKFWHVLLLMALAFTLAIVIGLVIRWQWITGAGGAVAQAVQQSTPTNVPMPTAAPTITAMLPTATMQPTNTLAPTQTNAPSATPTVTTTATMLPATATPLPPTPTATIAVTTIGASSVVTTTGQVTGTGQITATTTMTQGTWTLTYFSGATQEMREWKFQDPAPKSWSVFPNVTVTVKSVVYPAGHLLEYGQDTDFTCQDVGCFFVVPAGEYRVFSGDYSFPEIDEWLAKDNTGSAVMFINVGNQTAEWEALLKQGFTYRGRYWNGNYLPDAIWAGLSHVGYRMLNLGGDSANAGANCSNRDGCPKVRLTFVVVSGHEVLMKGTSFVSR